MIPRQSIYSHFIDRTPIIFLLAAESRVYENTLFTSISIANED